MVIMMGAENDQLTHLTQFFLGGTRAEANSTCPSWKKCQKDFMRSLFLVCPSPASLSSLVYAYVRMPSLAPRKLMTSWNTRIPLRPGTMLPRPQAGWRTHI
jgi:hypothetical protein